MKKYLTCCISHNYIRDLLEKYCVAEWFLTDKAMQWGDEIIRLEKNPMMVMILILISLR